MSDIKDNINIKTDYKKKILKLIKNITNGEHTFISKKIEKQNRTLFFVVNMHIFKRCYS